MCSVSARALLNVAYVLLFLDLLLYLAWVGGVIYVTVECPEELDFHVLFALSHLIVVVAVAGVVVDWWRLLQEEPHQLVITAPFHWGIAALVGLSTDTCLMLAQIRNPEPNPNCHFRRLHVALEGTGVAVCVLSLLWFMFVVFSTLRTQRRLARERAKALTDPANAHVSANLNIKL